MSEDENFYRTRELDVDFRTIDRETRGSLVCVRYARVHAGAEITAENMRKASPSAGWGPDTDVLVIGAVNPEGGARIGVLVRDAIADRLDAGALLAVLLRHVSGSPNAEKEERGFACGRGPNSSGLGDALALAPIAAAAVFVDAPLGPEKHAVGLA